MLNSLPKEAEFTFFGIESGAGIIVMVSQNLLGVSWQGCEP
jgi:hypothetical protein